MNTTLSTPTAASLASQLADFKAAFAGRASPERIATMESATAALRANGIEANARKVGQMAPDVVLPDALGRAVRLYDLWTRGPLVLVFYRGGWCPYCNLELRAWQALSTQLEDAGAQLVAVSPQTPDSSLSTAQKNALQFQVLSDSAMEAATGFGIAFDLPAELVAIYKGVGHDLPVTNGNGRWSLPVPATYVIGRDGRILYAHVEADYRVRAEPSEVLAVLQRLKETPAVLQ